jgi:uncharacterized membrane protein
MTATRVDPTTTPGIRRKRYSKASGPYGHPFHPILVTVPIGAWVASLVFDIASRVKDEGAPDLVHGAYWLIGIGIIGALLAAVFGLIDLSTIERNTPAFRVGLTHMALNLVVVALFVVNFFWRRGGDEEYVKVARGQLLLSIVAIALLGLSGWLGGKLTYRYGVRVADEDTQAEGFR